MGEFALESHRLEKIPADDIDEFLVARPVKQNPANKRSVQTRAVQAALTVRPVSDDALVRLVEPSRAYARALRVTLLRILLNSPAIAQLTAHPSFCLLQVCDFLGFANFDRFVENKVTSEIREALLSILKDWESKHEGRLKLPKVLQRNLSALSRVIELTELERDVLGFGILLHTEPILESCCCIMGAELSHYMVPRIIAPALDVGVDEVVGVLNRDAKLATSGLLTIEMRGRYDLRELMDLMAPTFANRMVSPQKDIHRLVDSFVCPSSRPSLAPNDLGHVTEWLGAAKAYLQAALAQHRQGVNILIYGKPGAGKSQFARVLANELGIQLMEINVMASNGAPIAPIRRLRNHRIAQSFLAESGALLLFDECEEIFDFRPSFDSSDDEVAVPRKSWLNMTLESNTVPTIWIANSVRGFDSAYIRRFGLCFEMPSPDSSQSLKIVSQAFGDSIGEATKQQIASSAGVAPALATQTADLVKEIAPKSSLSDRERLAIRILNEKLKAQDLQEVQFGTAEDDPLGGFDATLINCKTDLLQLRDGLKESGAGRLCIYGPPGTGKTAFGKWIAKELGRPHLTYRASDLIGSYVGQTERNIARAFDTARQQKAVLQFDEVDSYLQDRSKAQRGWEVTQVNEMLTQMEGFEGIFIASTNLFDGLDEASLRRFDLPMKFDFLAAEKSYELFAKLCNATGIKANNDHHLRIKGVQSLTPGDFMQVLRASKFIKKQTADQLLTQLIAAVALKKSARSTQIGFMSCA